MIFSLQSGPAPLLVSIPHDGREVPDGIRARMTDAATSLPDTDWHVRRLYGFAAGLGASVLAATHSRYVVDLNRDPDGAVLYPGADNTQLVPTSTFDHEPIYRPGQTPSDAEVVERIERYHRPYHDALAKELARIVDAHGVAVLFDAHSIRSQVPRFFDGVLPDLNLGTASGASADAGLAERVFEVLRGSPFSAVRDARFRGGYITRHYGAPRCGVHALQLELAQHNYMEESPPYVYDAERAEKLRVVLEAVLRACIEWAERKS